MKIIHHRLYTADGKPVAFEQTPNKGGIYIPHYLVMHYTAVTRAAGSVSWFLNKNAKASAHLLIDRDGSIVQFTSFNEVTWHAGVSRWNGLNQYSIGIELVNGGRLSKSGNNWMCPVDKRVVPDIEVVMAKHKNTKVQILKGEGNWRFVEVQGKVHGMNDLEGWVTAKYLVKK